MLVVVAVGAGHVSQLAAELIVTSLHMRIVGSLESMHVLPVFGYADDKGEEMVTNLDCLRREEVLIICHLCFKFIIISWKTFNLISCMIFYKLLIKRQTHMHGPQCTPMTNAVSSYSNSARPSHRYDFRFELN